MTRSLETHTIVWRGITIEVCYEEKWLGRSGPFSTAHLDVEAVDPDRALLPITETGYRLHFIDADNGRASLRTAIPKPTNAKISCAPPADSRGHSR